MRIKYVKMPVSVEDKRKLNKEGFKVIDIKFKPEEEKPKAKPKSKAKKS